MLESSDGFIANTCHDLCCSRHRFLYYYFVFFVLQVRSDVSVFEFNIRFAGGILSAYALTGDEVSRVCLSCGHRVLSEVLDSLVLSVCGACEIQVHVYKYLWNAIAFQTTQFLFTEV